MVDASRLDECGKVRIQVHGNRGVGIVARQLEGNPAARGTGGACARICRGNAELGADRGCNHRGRADDRQVRERDALRSGNRPRQPACRRQRRGCTKGRSR